jgi:hypothetical protein
VWFKSEIYIQCKTAASNFITLSYGKKKINKREEIFRVMEARGNNNNIGVWSRPFREEGRDKTDRWTDKLSSPRPPTLVKWCSMVSVMS